LLRVERLKKDLARDLAIDKHYLHRAPPISHSFGLLQEDEIVGLLTIGKPAPHSVCQSACPQYPCLVYEFNRLWVSDRMPRNTETWFIARARKKLPAMIVVTYADTAVGHTGTLYMAAGFHYAGWTDMERKTPRIDYILHNGKHSRDASRQGVIGQVETVRRSTKIRFWFAAGNHSERRRMEKLAGWPSLDWGAIRPPRPTPSANP